MKLHPPVPIFRIFDERAAHDYYVGFLGFTVDWTHRFEDSFPLYMQISRSECILHLSEHHSDCCPGARARIEVSGLNELHRELTDKHYNYAKPGIEDTPWGDREVCVADPFGNRLTFYESKEDA